MTNKEIASRFRKTIDQFFKISSREYIEQCKVHYIGGILQSALHILPLDEYYSLKVYIYERYGYDPGGVTDGQMTILEYVGKGD